MNVSQDFTDLSLPNSTLWMIPHPDLSLTANEAYARLLEEVPWEVKSRMRYGKEVFEPRMTSWHGDEGCHYTYSRMINYAKPWTPTLSALKDDMNRLLATQFNSVLCNYYRDGKDSIGAHSDDESELGSKPVIASLNLGGERVMRFRSKEPHGPRIDVTLTHGSLLVMAGDTQTRYTHQIDKVKHADPRINLTFRTIYPNRG